MTGAPHHASIAANLIAIAFVLVLFALRVRRMSRIRPLKLERLWVVPAIYAVVVASLLSQSPPQGLGWAVVAAGLVLGGALGWQRGKLMQIRVDPKTHALNQQASIAGVVFIVVLIAVRSAARQMGGEMHMNVALVTDTLAALALGMFSIQRLEMYLRARRLLDEARAAPS
jgi:hypothetical protein